MRTGCTHTNIKTPSDEDGALALSRVHFYRYVLASAALMHHRVTFSADCLVRAKWSLPYLIFVSFSPNPLIAVVVGGEGWPVVAAVKAPNCTLASSNHRHLSYETAAALCAACAPLSRPNKPIVKLVFMRANSVTSEL